MWLARALRTGVPKVHVQVLSKPDCCLCDQARFAITRIIENAALHDRVILESVNIETDQSLKDEYELTIPVILVNGKIVAESIIDVPAIRAAIQARIALLDSPS